MDLGRMLVIFGGVMIAAGLVVMAMSRLGFGRLPGDISVQRGSFTFSFPIVTSIVLSLILTIILNLALRRR
jgi:membrane protein implicated in regulation of membrane protease activity